MEGVQTLERHNDARVALEAKKPFDPEMLRGFIEEARERWKQNGRLTIAEDSASVIKTYQECDRFILEATPGSGKTTVAPVEFLDEELKRNPNALGIVTAPQKLIVESLSNYVGSEIGKNYVDFRHRKHPIGKEDSRLHFMVEGSLRNEIIKNPMLTGVSFVMIDEVHVADPILIGLLKDTQKARKEQDTAQLKLVLTSGTLDIGNLEQFLDDGTANVKTLHVEGRPHTIKEHFLDTPIDPEKAPEKAAETAKSILDKPELKGDLLVFMPGKKEIEQTKAELEKLVNDPNVEIVTIMGGDQDGNPYDKINNKPEGITRVYISTDVAELGLTIPDVTVIDSGLMKKVVYDPKTRVSTLVTMKHTQANQIQRKGRAGRTGEGNYYALFTKSELAAREQHQVSDFLRSDPTANVLWLKANGKDIYSFNYYPKPPERAVLDQAVENLQKLGAFDENGNVTEIGRKMAEMDVEPEFARMLVEAESRKCTSAVALLIGAMKTNKSIFEVNTKTDSLKTKHAKYIDEDSDFITFLNGWNAYVGGNKQDFNEGAVESIKRERNKLRIGGTSPDVAGVPIDSQGQIDAINMCIASGLLGKAMELDGGGYKFKGAEFSGTGIDKISGLYGKGLSELLSGKIQSTQKDRRGPKTFSIMNIKFDKDYKEKILSQFEYARKFFTSEQPKEVETAVEEEAPQPELEVVSEPAVANETDLRDTMDNIQEALLTTTTKKEAETFIQKIRENWHKLTDAIKAQFIKFKNAIKRIF